jgi:NAD(P)-dependent dehydrogenase (short-subunit alcohol dehydrogenase family)
MTASPRESNTRTAGRLAGKTALVTGSTRGLGRTIAEWLAREGAAVVVSGREPDAVDASVAAIKALGVDSFGIPADLSRVERLDVLVNNAGMSLRGHFWDVSDEEWEHQLNVLRRQASGVRGTGPVAKEGVWGFTTNWGCGGWSMRRRH